MEGGTVKENLPFADYLNIDAISATFIKAFAKCPAASGLPVERTRNMIIGSAVHSLALEGEEAFYSEFVVAPKVNKRTNGGKAEWAEFEQANAGKTVLEAGEFEAVQGCAISLKSHPLAKRMLRESEGQPEVTLQWRDSSTGLAMKSRLDRLPCPDKRVILDIKTTSDASLSAFSRSIVKFSYDLQAAVYANGAKACGIDVDSFVFIAVQSSAPYPVSVVTISSEWLAWAQNEVDRIMGLICECKKHGTWPAYQIPQHIYSLSQLTTSDLLEVLDMPRYR